MIYVNNQYLRLEETIEEISKIRIKMDENNRMIEDLEMTEYEPNIIIASGEKVNYNNIYGTVKILITDIETIEKNYDKIPENIEKIIISGEIIENKISEINGYILLRATARNNEELAMKILERDNINVNIKNKNGFTSLIWACYNKMDIVAIKILERGEIEINHNQELILLSMCESEIMNDVKRRIKEITKTFL